MEVKASGVLQRLDGPVLIGFADALAAIESAWSLVDAGAEVVVFTRRGRKSPLVRSHAVGAADITAPELDSRQALEDLREVIRRIRPSAVLPLDDWALWLCGKACDGSGPALAGPRGDQLELALDKRLQLDAARAAGFVAPPTRLYPDARALAIQERDFPLIAKPAMAVWEHRGRLHQLPRGVFGDSDELKRAAWDWPGEFPLVAQPLISGTGEGLFGLATSGTVSTWSAHRRIRMMNPRGSGSSACMSIPVDPLLTPRAEQMIRDSGWQGIFMLEFLRDRRGTAWFMELNGRPWGSMALARRVGLEYPAWAVACAVEPSFRPEVAQQFEGMTCRHLGRELVHLLTVMRGNQVDAVPGWPGRLSTLRDVLKLRRGDRFYNWRPGEPRLFAADSVDTVLAAIRQRRR